MALSLRDVFDVPDLGTTNDDIVNGDRVRNADGSLPLALFTAQPWSITRWQRLAHYTATSARAFPEPHSISPTTSSNVDEFEAFAPRHACAIPTAATPLSSRRGTPLSPTRMERSLPCPACRKMPTLSPETGDGPRALHWSISASAPRMRKPRRTISRCCAPHAWLMVGHCAGLRNSQALGDFVLAHAYLREDNVLDGDFAGLGAHPGALRKSRSRCKTRRVAQVTKLEWLRAETDHAHRHGRHHRQTAIGSCATNPARCSGLASRARSRLDMGNAPTNRGPTGSASGCPMARFYACRTSPCMAN